MGRVIWGGAVACSGVFQVCCGEKCLHVACSGVYDGLLEFNGCAGVVWSEKYLLGVFGGVW